MILTLLKTMDSHSKGINYSNPEAFPLSSPIVLFGPIGSVLMLRYNLPVASVSHRQPIGQEIRPFLRLSSSNISFVLWNLAA